MAGQKILFVDDDPNLLAAFQRNLRKQFEFDTALGAEECLGLIKQSGPYAVVVADMQMPGMNGVELLARVRETCPDTVRVMLTGNADQQTAIDAVNRGHVYSFLTKPCEPETLKTTLESSLKQYQLVKVERELLENTLAGSVKVLGEVLSMIDPASFGLGQKLRDSMRVFGRWMNLNSTWELEVAAMLAHLGYTSIPPAILRKRDQGMALFPREQMIVTRAPQVGHDLLANIPRLENVAKIILYQNKHFDGSGFPTDSTAGERIPIGARMLKILIDRTILEADGIVKAKAFETMRNRVGVYDPDVLEKCFRCFQTFLENAISAEKQVVTLNISELQPGQVVVSDIVTLTGALMVSAGNSLTESMIRRLKNHAEFGEVKEPVYVQ